MKRVLPALLLASLIATAAPAAPRATGPEGIWRNARDTVRIRVQRCGRGLCGRVVQAAPVAREAAAAGGTPRLVGTDLFRGLERGEDGLWYGEVYVPDLGRAVEGSLEQVNRDLLVAEGCLFAGFGCKTQEWTRVR
ncbi:MAG TPA: DUF2147 domain-containing protein [Sphingomonas sp.]|jgi:uncharacterized protein (DUF2147 family)|uniref:DUF2147 domain-containing protein n=1 Tax=Sphingomonas sp. TaxID=28214 RepID=UPI002EDAFEB7